MVPADGKDQTLDPGDEPITEEPVNEDGRSVRRGAHLIHGTTIWHCTILSSNPGLFTNLSNGAN